MADHTPTLDTESGVPVTGDFAYHTPLQVSLSSQDALADFDKEYTGGFIEKQQRPGRPVTRDASDLPTNGCVLAVFRPLPTLAPYRCCKTAPNDPQGRRSP